MEGEEGEEMVLRGRERMTMNMNRRLSPLPPTTIPHSFVLGTTVINNNNYDLGLANIGYMLN